jgi:hypothetical protein
MLEVVFVDLINLAFSPTPRQLLGSKAGRRCFLGTVTEDRSRER